jgi:hypothetical protein
LPSGGGGDFRVAPRWLPRTAAGRGWSHQPRDCAAHHMFVRQGRAKGGPLMVLNLAVQDGDALGAGSRRSLQFRLWPDADLMQRQLACLLFGAERNSLAQHEMFRVWPEREVQQCRLSRRSWR